MNTMTYLVSLRARSLAPTLARLFADESSKSTSQSKKIFSQTIDETEESERIY